MAQRAEDSDSSEYEVMLTPGSPASAIELSVQQAKTASEVLEISKNFTDKDKKTKKSKKKGLFRRMSKSSRSKKTRDHGESVAAAAAVVSPVVPRKLPKKNRSSPSLPIEPAPPPIPGPKPPRKLSEEEQIKKIRRQQKEVVALARQDRLRKTQDTAFLTNQYKQKAHPAEDYEPDYTVDRSYGEMETVDIVKKYSEHLPLKVVVSKGIYGMEERYSLATSDRCIIHYIKKRELVQIQDPDTNKEFSVPLNSAIKFGVVYNPDSDDRKAMMGYTFQYVSDILSQTKLPKFGLARVEDPDINMKSVEVVVIKQIIFPENPIDPRKLRVYSLTAKCHRDLPETLEINFRTTPNFLQIYLPDIFKHLPDACPLHIAMYRNPLARPLIAPGIPSSMFRRVLYMKKKFTDILLVATGCTDDSQDEPFEIPTDIDVEFQVMKLTNQEKDKLKEESRKLKEKSKNKEIRHHRYIGVTDEHHRMQLSLYKSVLEGGGLEGGASAGGQEEEEGADGDYVKATSGNRLAMNHRVELLEENMKRCSHSVAEAKASLAVLTQDNARLTDRVISLEETVSQQRAQLDLVESLGRQMDTMFSELEQLREEVTALRGGQAPPTKTSKIVSRTPPISGSPIQAPPTTTPPSGEKRWEEPSEVQLEEENSEELQRNKRLLSEMTKTEVARMLQRAGLGQYAGTIQAEGVSGDILVECNEDILEKEMNIKSKLHRLKLLRVIEGKASLELYKLVD